MDIETIQAICKKYKGVTEDIKWVDHLCFNVSGKMFLITAPDNVPISASLKVTDEVFGELCDKEGFMPAPYLARYNWIWMDDIGRLSKKQWEIFIDAAYHLVASKLPSRTRKQLGL